MSTDYPSLEEFHEYWMNNPKQHPTAYLNKTTRSQTLLNIIKRHSKPHDNILEIGSNIGRNLKHLFDAGYKNLHCVEINHEAINQMKHFFPEVAENTEIYVDSIENVIIDFADEQFDTVFTMAVLEHIHFESEWIFPEIARITGNTLITIEDERTESWNHFRRNYKDIFKKMGLKHVDVSKPKGLSRSFKARVFKKTMH